MSVSHEELSSLIDQARTGPLSLRIDAVTRLAECKGDRSVEALIDALKDRNYKVRWAAVDSLAKIGSSAAKSALIEALQDTNRDVQKFTAEALGLLKVTEAVPSLLEVLDRTLTPLVRIYVTDALACIADPKALPHLLRQLESRDSLVRGHAALALGDIGEKSAAFAIEAALSKERAPSARVAMMVGLYKLGEKEFLKEIIRFLKSKNYRMRSATANLLAEIADARNHKAIVPALLKALEEESTIAAKSSIERSLSLIRGSHFD